MKTQKISWNDLYIAYQVAKLGTLSAAATALDVHHSTVLRRINALESQLGVRLFHRHARGYRMTQAGQTLAQTAENTQHELDHMCHKIQGADSELRGTLVVTSVASFAEQLMPLLARFQQQYPEIRLEVVIDSKLMRLDHGEAHVSLRPGAKPEDLDYVVQNISTLKSTLYASQAYLEKFGPFHGCHQLQGHRFIGTTKSYDNVKGLSWLQKNIPQDQIYFRVNDIAEFIPATQAGLGIGLINCWLATLAGGLKPLMPAPEDWDHDLWMLTHRDFHRTSKVQAFTSFIKNTLPDLLNERKSSRDNPS